MHLHLQSFIPAASRKSYIRRTKAKKHYISVLYNPSESFLEEGSEAGVMSGQGFSDEAPFYWGCCSRQAFCQQGGQAGPENTTT